MGTKRKPTEREWKECDLCAKEVFTKKDADGFISICPECREQDEKRLEQLAAKDKRIEGLEQIEVMANLTKDAYNTNLRHNAELRQKIADLKATNEQLIFENKEIRKAVERLEVMNFGLKLKLEGKG